MMELMFTSSKLIFFQRKETWKFFSTRKVLRLNQDMKFTLKEEKLKQVLIFSSKILNITARTPHP